MPIAFARLEFVSRSDGKNACAKAAYNSRTRIEFQGNTLANPKTYDWSSHKSPIHHEVMLPRGVDEKFKSPQILWNAVEQKEVRKNSQTAIEMVLALPDDKVISTEDRIHLARTFVDEHFVSQGLAAQIDIHPPDTRQIHTAEGLQETKEHNWHAHIILTTRRFKQNGQEFEDHKARDLVPTMRGGRVVSGPNWGRLWAQHQNDHFEQKGLSLRVDPEGIVPQKHLGPVRMRGRAFSLMHENDVRISLNRLECANPQNILEKITETKNVFSREDIEHFIETHVDSEHIDSVRETFWKQQHLVQLLDPTTQKPLNRFTTQTILEEESRTLRLADHLSASPAFKTYKKAAKHSEQLTEEQRQALQGVLSGSRLTCIEGHAGTGKSYLLNALRKTYETSGLRVRGLGPDSSTADVLKKGGFNEAENVYRFLFAVQNNQRIISKHREVWIIDEAGKLGTAPTLELLKFAKKYGAQVIFSGDSSQLPSVGRGGMFQTFSEKYGAQYLKNVQRQKDPQQREIARKLAIGEMGQALDAIVSHGGIKWYPTKERASEELIKKWAYNHTLNPSESTLIIAHSNREVRVLNELARLYRKEAGELDKKEFVCESTTGKIYVSCGDRIEFRKNNKELGVTNGMSGILVHASEAKFTIQLSGLKTPRRVSFDPRQYRNYQLGYATTYYRSQGRTVDRAYVLHSPMMNKEMFYVGLTRHVKRAELYISEADIPNLSTLKAQAFKSTHRPTTLEYLTAQELDHQKEANEKHHTIEALKASDSLLSQVRGQGLSIWEGLREKVHKTVEHFKDTSPDRVFFKPTLRSEETLGHVEEVVEKTEEKSPKIETEQMRTEFRRAIDLQEERGRSRKPTQQSKISTHSLPDDQQELVKRYFQSIDRASNFYAIVSSEESLRSSPHFSEWQTACHHRNELAYEISKTLDVDSLKSVFSSKTADILHDRAQKHRHIVEKQSTKRDIEEELTEHLEGLLHKLFPEGPTRRDNRGLRFRNKGSLAVTCSGPKAGSFFDFENQEGGGPIRLVQKVMNVDRAEALSWSQDFLGNASDLQVPTQFHFKHAKHQAEWVSLRPQANHPAPTLSKLSRKLAADYEETARYTYHDREGNELYYVLRLEQRNGAAKKIILPLSFGCHEGNADHPSWALKGFQSENRPLYNLHLLNQYPMAKVFVVEGEKTAESASKLFPPEEMICVTWSGGASAVAKGDWQVLKGREIIIWPDNDRAGIEAASQIVEELHRVHPDSVKMVSKDVLAQNLPPKWDLADLVPEELGEDFVRDTLLRSEQVNITSVNRDKDIERDYQFEHEF